MRGFPGKTNTEERDRLLPLVLGFEFGERLRTGKLGVGAQASSGLLQTEASEALEQVEGGLKSLCGAR